MKSRLYQLFRIPSLLLAAALQILPIVRAALPATETASNILAIVFRWSAGASAALGGVQAVSGASTVITCPLSTNIVEGQPFSMRLTTAPDQAHYWEATGLPAKLSLSGTSGLTLWSIVGTPTVSGTYNVGLTAKDQATSGASRTVTATLVINIAPAAIAPTITTQPTSQTITQGQSATFSVVAAGSPPLTYQWRFQGGNLWGETSSNLVLNSVTTANGGNYDVVVSNSSGSVTSAVAKLTVTVPIVSPAITMQPTPLTVTQGQDATFTVGANGTAPLSYYWRKSTTVLRMTTVPAFTITNSQTADAGSYSVIVSNSAGTATSASVNLTVNPAPQAPFVSVSPTNHSVLLGSPTTFTVVAGGTAPLAYQWFFNTLPLAGQTTASLTLASVQPSDVGDYFVVVANSLGSATSAVATLSLLTPPSITTQPQGQTNNTGANVSFSVLVTSGAPVTYQWLKDGANLANDNRISGAQASTLKLTGLLTSDSGDYSVVASNPAGAVTSQVATLTVVVPPAVLARLTVVISGSGSVNPDYNGQLLNVGASYTMTAVPGAGYVFTGWTGGFVSGSPALTFVMQSNLVLRANFASEAVSFRKGTYNGLFYESTGVSHFSSGSITLRTTDKGRYSGALVFLGKKYTLSGQFDASGRATNSLPRESSGPLRVELEINPGDPDLLNGVVTDGSWTAPLLADRAVFNKKTNPAPQAGTYTLVIPGGQNPAANPGGDGFGTVRIDASGRVRFKGMLSDGTKVTQSTTISKSGEWPLYASLYSGQGSVLSWLAVSNGANGGIGGLLTWDKGQQPTDRYYPFGFALEILAVGSRYAKYHEEDRMLDLSHGLLWLTGGNLTQNITNRITLNSENKVTNLSNNKLKLSISTSSGMLKGKVTDPTSGKTLNVRGVILQNQNAGRGFFLGRNQSGAFYLGP